VAGANAVISGLVSLPARSRCSVSWNFLALRFHAFERRTD